MDSCNSGSLGQSSSGGGDDEYDSRATFMSYGIGQVNPNPPPPTPFFDPFIASYTQKYDVTSYPNTTPSITDSSILNSTNETTANNYPFTPPSHPLPATAPPPQQKTAARNPKKRSRASRRAPTTVLTTDTTNFRAMVQEFTGIPAPPFSNITSSFARNRLDLFASSIDMPSYLRSSFAQRVQSSSVLPFLGGQNNSNNIIVGSTSVASSSSTQSLNLLGNNTVDEQSPFLGSMDFPANHQKIIDSYNGLRSKDGTSQLIDGSIGFFSPENDQIGVSNNASAAFDGGLQNLIIPSSPPSSNNITNLLTRNQENADVHGRITGKSTMVNHRSLSGFETQRRE